MSSCTGFLGRKYGSFFWGCTKFAFSPYISTFKWIANDDQNPNHCNAMVDAAAVTALFTFVVPILPALSSITFALASIAMLLATASMFITYPVAILTDGCLSSTRANEPEVDDCCFAL